MLSLAPPKNCAQDQSENCEKYPNIVYSLKAETVRVVEWFGSIDANSWTAFGTIVLAALTVLLARIAWQQFTTSRAQLRAYVALRPIHISSFDNDNRPIVELCIINTGITPAYRLRHHSQVEIFPHPLPDGFSLPPIRSEWSPPIVVFPNDPSAFTGTHTAGVAFTAEEIASIRAGSHRVYVFGLGVYRDAFGYERWTSYCSSIVADSETLERLTSNWPERNLNVRFETAPIGNDAT